MACPLSIYLKNSSPAKHISNYSMGFSSINSLLIRRRNWRIPFPMSKFSFNYNLFIIKLDAAWCPMTLGSSQINKQINNNTKTKMRNKRWQARWNDTRGLIFPLKRWGWKTRYIALHSSSKQEQRWPCHFQWGPHSRRQSLEARHSESALLQSQ